MSFTVHSFGQSPGATSADAVVAKPSGLAVGDTMIAHIATNAEGGTGDPPTGLTEPSGWTEINSSFGGTSIWCGWKIADSSDVAASDFTFTFTGHTATLYTKAAITRIFGGRETTIAYVENEAGSTGTAVTVSTITPNVADSLLLFLVSAEGSSAKTVSGYAIATSDPTWTEVYDLFYDGGAAGVGVALAYGERPETTATGDWTATISASSDWRAQVFAIEPQISASVSDSVNAAEAAALVGLGFNASESVSLTEVTATEDKKLWVTIAYSTTPATAMAAQIYQVRLRW